MKITLGIAAATAVLLGASGRVEAQAQRFSVEFDQFVGSTSEGGVVWSLRSRAGEPVGTCTIDFLPGGGERWTYSLDGKFGAGTLVVASAMERESDERWHQAFPGAAGGFAGTMGGAVTGADGSFEGLEGDIRMDFEVDPDFSRVGCTCTVALRDP